jgi:hypothetical protein
MAGKIKKVRFNRIFLCISLTAGRVLMKWMTRFKYKKAMRGVYETFFEPSGDSGADILRIVR